LQITMVTSTVPAANRARWLRTGGLVTIALSVTFAVWYGLENWAQRHGFFDLRIYRSAVQWWLDGKPLYEYVQPNTGGLGFTYPPFAAALMMPMAPMDWEDATTIASIGTAAAITLTTWYLVAPVAERNGWPRWFSVWVAVPLVCALEPIRETMGFGQVNMLLVGLVLLDLWALSRGYKWAGVGIGLAAAIKITPAFFVAYLLVSGRRRAAGVAVGTAVGATLLTGLFSPSTSWQFWTDTLWQTDRVGRYDYVGNQSWMGLLARLVDGDEPNKLIWLAGVALIGAFGLWRARRAWLAGDDLAGFTLTGLTAVLLCPISWTHHLYWIVPALVVLVAVAAERRNWWYAVAAAFVWAPVAGSLIWPFNHRAHEHYSDGWPGVVGENAYVLILMALVALLPARSPAVVPVSPAVGSSRAEAAA
jgi:alpha-1,2-mannosyltransferase